MRSAITAITDGYQMKRHCRDSLNCKKKAKLEVFDHDAPLYQPDSGFARLFGSSQRNSGCFLGNVVIPLNLLKVLDQIKVTHDKDLSRDEENNYVWN